MRKCALLMKAARLSSRARASICFAVLFQAVPAQSSDARKAEARQRIEAGSAAADATPAQGGRGAAASGFGAVAAEYSEDQSSAATGVATSAGSRPMPPRPAGLPK